MAQKPKRAPDTIPDSPPRDENIDLPDGARRTDVSQEVSPDLLPGIDDEEATIDGGNPNHPVHDEDQEDLGPEDYEEEIEEVEETGGIRPD